MNQRVYLAGCYDCNAVIPPAETPDEASCHAIMTGHRVWWRACDVVS